VKDIASAIRRQVPSVPKALAMLVAMEQELTNASTYEQINKVIREASALKALMAEVDDVRTQADITILIAQKRIGLELAKVPKASGGNPKVARSQLSRAGTEIEKTKRHRYKKLASIPDDKIRETSAKLHSEGKDATMHAVVLEVTYGDKKQRRDNRVTGLTKGLPPGQFVVFSADPPWKTETWSDKGMDRSADNHYPTMTLEELMALDVPSIGARNRVMFGWSTGPHLRQAMTLYEHWGFEYKAILTWDKVVPGTGKWLLNQTEHLLIYTRGNIPAPGSDLIISSLWRESKGRHSAKPEGLLDWIDRLYPTPVPKIEMFRRGPARPGWVAYGNEVPE